MDKWGLIYPYLFFFSDFETKHWCMQGLFPWWFVQSWLGTYGWIEKIIPNPIISGSFLFNLRTNHNSYSIKSQNLKIQSQFKNISICRPDMYILLCKLQVTANPEVFLLAFIDSENFNILYYFYNFKCLKNIRAKNSSGIDWSIDLWFIIIINVKCLN